MYSSLHVKVIHIKGKWNELLIKINISHWIRKISAEKIYLMKINY